MTPASPALTDLHTQLCGLHPVKIAELLEQQQWRRAGRTAATSIYTSNAYAAAAKIQHSPQGGFNAFTEALLATDWIQRNTWLPRIHAHSSTYGVTMMEQLLPYAGRDSAKLVIESREAIPRLCMINHSLWRTQPGIALQMVEHLPTVLAHEQRQPGLADALLFLACFIQGDLLARHRLQFDVALHLGNLMQRANGELVLIDALDHTGEKH